MQTFHHDGKREEAYLFSFNFKGLPPENHRLFQNFVQDKFAIFPDSYPIREVSGNKDESPKEFFESTHRHRNGSHFDELPKLVW